MQDSTYNMNKQIPCQDDDLVCREVLRILRAIKASDVTAESKGRQEQIFQRITEKVNVRESRLVVLKRKSLWQRISVVAAVLLFLVVSGIGVYRMGYDSGIAMQEEAMIEITSPMGVLSNVSLPDGSLVTLNAGSTLTYPSFFSSERKITLKGEGYFDVAKDKKRPFIVYTDGMNVKVLGTRFSLKAYQKEEQTLLTLEEGCVEASTNVGNIAENIILMPNQQLILNNRTGELMRKNVNTDFYTEWRDGKLIFRDAPLASIALELERRFNVRILFEDTVYQSDKYYVIFEHDETLIQILNLLSYKRNWVYRMNGNEVRILNK